MSKIRSLVELYELLLEQVKLALSPDNECWGICSDIFHLYHKSIITLDEHFLLRDHFRNYPAPPAFVEFEPYYFHEADVVSRIEFIENIIESLKSENEN